MKNFDIENLERKNIYKTSDDVFEKVQMNVLEKISQQNEKQTIGQPAKVFHLRPVIYAVAASLVLLFSLMVLNPFGEKTTNEIQPSVAINEQNISPTQTVATPEISQITPTSDSEKATIETIVTPTPKRIAKVEATANAKRDKVSKNINLRTQTKNSSAETEMKEFLSNFTSAELADLSTGSEQDVYLDLYK